MNLPFPHQKEIALSKYSTFGIGGPARFFAEVKSIFDLQEILAFVHRASLRYLILGKGSNVLFDDRGFNGLVILNRIEALHDEQEGRFTVGSGYSFARLGKMTARQGWSGLEFAAGIPASVGGAIFMNAGSNKNEIATTLVEVGYISEKGEFLKLKKENLCFGYRKSSFQDMKGAIVEARFQLQASAGAIDVQKKLLSYRLKTQPYGKKSAGCVFRNPTENIAGQLIENCGLKNLSIGGAYVSSLHANFIVNQGNATAKDVLELMKKIKEYIYQTKGILLEEEIRFIPYDL